MISLSKRQYQMLEVFVKAGPGYYMKIEEAQAFDQRPFRSMLIQQWIAFTPGRGFHVTREGRDSWNEFLNADIVRKDPSRPLTRYFDAEAYGLRPSKKALVHVMPRRRVA